MSLKNSKIKLALVLIIGFLILRIGGGRFSALFTPSSPKGKATNQQQEQQEEGKLREYKVVDRKVSEQVLGENLDEAFEESLKENPARNKELVLQVDVPLDIDEKDLKFTVSHIIDEEISKDGDLDEIIVFVSDREQDINSAYVARAIWAFEGELGKITKEVAKNNDRSSYKIKWDIPIKENQNSLKKDEGTTISQETEEDLSVSKDRFSYYGETFIKLRGLQEKYEKVYRENGVLSSKEITENFADSLMHAEKYGSIKNEIISVCHSLPKFNSAMSPGEKYLIFKLSDYCFSIFFITPKEEGIEGMDSVLESKKALEDALKRVKDSNVF